MTHTRIVRVLALAVLVLFGAAACGGSEVTVGGASQSQPEAGAPAEPETVAEAPAEASAVADPEPAEVAAPAEPPVGSQPEEAGEQQGTVTVSFDDGRSWTFAAAECVHDPDGALGLSISGTGDGTVEVDIFSTRALDEFTDADAAQIYFASFVDEDDTLYQFEEPQSFDASGGQIRLTAAVHSNLFYQIGDAPDAVATVTC